MAKDQIGLRCSMQSMQSLPLHRFTQFTNSKKLSPGKTNHDGVTEMGVIPRGATILRSMQNDDSAAREKEALIYMEV